MKYTLEPRQTSRQQTTDNSHRDKVGERACASSEWKHNGDQVMEEQDEGPVERERKREKEKATGDQATTKCHKKNSPGTLDTTLHMISMYGSCA